MTSTHSLILFLAGGLAGFIDSIAGGGGLITVPTVALFLGMGPETIGTNKIAGTISALVALTVYSLQGHMNWKKGWKFTLCIVVGSYLGSTLNPYLPLSIFKALLLLTCPPLLWIIWKKDLWIEKEKGPLSVKRERFMIPLLGLACGFYDGVWGPGGGTFMFLSLFFVAQLPLFTALAISKLANMLSAGVALLNFSIHGYVHWDVGLWLSTGVVLGSFLGSTLASKKAGRIIRPTLVIVVFLLCGKVLFG